VPETISPALPVTSVRSQSGSTAHFRQMEQPPHPTAGLNHRKRGRTSDSSHFDHERSATRASEGAAGATRALTMRARHEAFSRGGYQDSRVWRDGVPPPARSGTQMRHVSTAVASWATAELPVTRYGTGRERMVGLLSRSSVWWASRWQPWIRAWTVMSLF
jgi:hypothetical protein